MTDRNAHGFIAARLTIDHKIVPAIIEWTAPDAVSVSVELPPRPDRSRSRCVWKGAPEGGTQLQDELSRLRSRTSGQGQDYGLSLSQGGQPRANLAWSTQDEPVDLAHLRGELERLAHLPFEVARAYYERGTHHKDTGALALALDDLRDGIHALGDVYRSPSALDDTGMKLALAEQEEKQGRLDITANLYARVLESRLAQYETSQAGHRQ